MNSGTRNLPQDTGKANSVTEPCENTDPAAWRGRYGAFDAVIPGGHIPVWRNERDSVPRYELTRTPHFQAAWRGGSGGHPGAFCIRGVAEREVARGEAR